MSDKTRFPFRIDPEKILGDLRTEPSETPIPEAIWYEGDNVGDGLLYRFPMGALEGANYLAADMLARYGSFYSLDTQSSLIYRLMTVSRQPAHDTGLRFSSGGIVSSTLMLSYCCCGRMRRMTRSASTLG